MKTIHLDGHEIPYKIAKKNNKNTYFYFKKDGFIQVNLSRYQSTQDAINYMKKHKSSFLQKFHQNSRIKYPKKEQYYLWGVPFNTVLSTTEEFYVSHDEKTIIYDPNNIDHKNRISEIEKQEMLQRIQVLDQKYRQQSHVSLDKVTYFTSYTTSRHGSCNPTKKHIRLSTYLVALDPIYTEYVYCHEIAHLNVPNHSQQFYDLLSLLCPNYKSIREQLKKVW
jgi:predicted metal-dependent hydrolase